MCHPILGKTGATGLVVIVINTDRFVLKMQRDVIIEVVSNTALKPSREV